jgi:hypothetical protein
VPVAIASLLQLGAYSFHFRGIPSRWVYYLCFILPQLSSRKMTPFALNMSGSSRVFPNRPGKTQWHLIISLLLPPLVQCHEFSNIGSCRDWEHTRTPSPILAGLLSKFVAPISTLQLINLTMYLFNILDLCTGTCSLPYWLFMYEIMITWKLLLYFVRAYTISVFRLGQPNASASTFSDLDDAWAQSGFILLNLDS